MKKIFLSCLSCFFLADAFSQPWPSRVEEPRSFYSIRKAWSNYLGLGSQGQQADGEEAKFRRWENFWEPRTYPSGNFPPADFLWTEWNRYRSLQQARWNPSAANWIPLENPAGFPANGYAGRVNCIAFHPTDTNIFYIGMPAGGLWKTTDGGLNWIPLTDHLPSLGVSEILINPQNPDILYMATGDKDGASFISNPYSYGLLKSMDGGISWDTTGLSHLVDDQMRIYRLLIHPTQPDILLAAVSGVNGNFRGIYKSIDAGVTWSKKYGGAKYDMEFNPANPAILYASAWQYLIRSTDTGSTWTTISSPVLPSSGITYSRIAVTPAQPDLVYVQYLDQANGYTYGLYKSSDAGITWSQQNAYVLSTQGGYDWVLAASPVDTNLVLYGGQSMFRSTNGGLTSTFSSSAHVDHHGLDYRPGSTVLFNCNDGGVYKSYDHGITWINLNRSLQTFQYYRLGCSATDPGFILTGAQDNGTWKHNYPYWSLSGWGDGMECIVDYSDTAIYYTASQYGNITRHGQGLGVFTPPPTAGNSTKCAWVTPYLIHPANPATLFFGAKDIYKTTNRFNTWTSYSVNLTINDNIGGGMLRNMAISLSNPDSVMYAVSYVVVYKTVDAGTTWQDVTANLPTVAGCFDCSALSDIEIHPTNPDIAWVTMSGYSDSNRVFLTTDGGLSWINFSGSLPRIPVNCIVAEANSPDGLYIGTDLGVFYRDSTLTDWIPYMSGLPNVPVQELEIHYASGKIRAATFGRGLWESDLSGVATSANAHPSNDPPFEIYPNPVNGLLTIAFKAAATIVVTDMTGRVVIRRTFPADPMQKKILDITALSPGVYMVGTGNQARKFVKH